VGGLDLDIEFLVQAPILAGILIHSALIVGVLLLALRYARPPFGAMSLLVGVSSAMTILMRARYTADMQTALLIASLVAGGLADLLIASLRPSSERPWRTATAAAGVPMLVYGAYFVALWVAGGTWWTIHLSGGSVVLAGVVGWLMAVLGGGRSTPGAAREQ
jgi:hypothetical protein